MRYFTTLLWIMIAFSVLAQSDPKAREVLDKAAARFKAYPAAEIDFTLAMENKAENIQETHSGKAWMKGNLYRLDLMDVENYYDGKVIYTYMPEVKEVNIKTPSDEEEGSLNPATLFDIHNQGFNQKLLSTSNDVAYIELYPKEKKNIEKIGVWAKLSSSSIQKVTSFGKDGNNVIITIKNIKSINPAPSDDFFKFDTTQHPDVEIIDMR